MMNPNVSRSFILIKLLGKMPVVNVIFAFDYYFCFLFGKKVLHLPEFYF